MGKVSEDDGRVALRGGRCLVATDDLEPGFVVGPYR